MSRQASLTILMTQPRRLSCALRDQHWGRMVRTVGSSRQAHDGRFSPSNVRMRHPHIHGMGRGEAGHALAHAPEPCTGAPEQGKAGMGRMHPHKGRPPRSSYPSARLDRHTSTAGTGRQGRRERVKILDTMHQCGAHGTGWSTTGTLVCAYSSMYSCTLMVHEHQHEAGQDTDILTR